jgi:general secretion pathway protein L
MARIWIDLTDGAAWLQRDGAVVAWRVGQPVPSDAGITAIAPAESAALHRIEVPARRGADVRQAVPFALEDRLAEPVESLQFAIGTRDGARLEVAVVARRALQTWIERLQAMSVAADQMVVDAHLLPRTDDAVHVARLGDRLLVATPDAAFALALADWPRWRALLPDVPVRAMAGDGTFADPGDREPPLVERPVFIRQATASGAAAPDLLQGDFAPRKRTADAQRIWRWAAILAGVAVVLGIADAAVGVLSEQARRDRLRAEQAQLFREVLPDARMTGDPAAQLAGELERSRRGGRAGGPFAMLIQAAPLIAQGSRYRLESLDYRLGVLELEIATGNVAGLDALRESLAAAGLSVEVTGVNPGDDGVRGRLRLRGAAS